MLRNLFKKKQAKEIPSKRDLKVFQLKVKEVIKETSDAITIVFEKPEETFHYEAGQFLTLILTIRGKKLRRAYSLSTSPLTDVNWAVTVKKEHHGVVSTYLCSEIKVGQIIEVMEPMGSFTMEVEPEKQRHIVLFAGGSGITPLFSIAKTVLAGEIRSKVTLIYSSRNESSIIFFNQLNDLKQSYGGRINLEHVLTKPSSTWDGPIGRIDPNRVKELLNKYNWNENENYEFYVCGPDGLMDCVITALHSLNIPAEKIRKESFVPGNTTDKEILLHESIENESVPYEVTVIYEGEQNKFIVPPDKNILEVGLNLDIDLPYSCRSGICTSCRGRCISGKVKMDESEGLSDEELEEGYVLTCQSHPLTEGVVIEIG